MREYVLTEGDVVLARSTRGGERGPREICFALLKEQAGTFAFLRGPLYATAFCGGGMLFVTVRFGWAFWKA